MRIRTRSVRRARSSRVTSVFGALVATLALIGSVGVASPVAAATPEAAVNAPVAASPTVDAGIIKAAAVVGFNAESIISDALFYDSSAMSAAEIQSFLDSKIGACQNGKCLNVLQVNGVSAPIYYSQTTGNLVCEAITGGSMRVSEWIYRIQRACGISAKVILVTLQKEQGLVTDKAPTDYELLAAMGHECPDTARCNPAVAGTMLQIYKGAEQLKKYKATAFGKQPGRNWIGYNPNSACGGTYLNIQNYATAALYNYTPYQPNAAALAAGFAYGDTCSSYGNRNFYNYYTQWFGSTQYPQTDTPFFDVSSVETSAVYSVFAQDIVWAAANGISTGWVVAPGATEFRPAAPVTRDVMAAFLYRLAGSPSFDAPSTSPFSDVGPGDTFYREMAWLSASGVSEGWEVAGDIPEFRPNEPVTRDVMAAFIYRFSGSPPYRHPSSAPFEDVPASHPFAAPIAWLAQVGISAGWATGSGAEYRPDSVVTREVMAAFLHRAFGYLNSFSDVASRHDAPAYSVFAADIAWLAATRISEGWALPNGAREYRPQASVSRDVMAAFLYRLAGSPEFTPPIVSPFSDVPVDRTFYKEISWLSSTGISEGWQVPGASEREFRPAAPVTRDVMAAFLYRFAAPTDFASPAVSPFRDVAAGGQFYTEISWMAEAGVSLGWAAGATASDYRPSLDVSRDVMAAFLGRLERHLIG